MNKILEKDIYNFVFYPDELSSERFSYIAENLNKYSEQIELLYKIKQNLKNSLSDEKLSKLELLVSKNEKSNITLYKVDYEETKGIVKLAAESPSIENEVTTNTFRDLNNKFLLKINTTPARSKLYFFNSDASGFSKVNLKVNPCNKRFTFSSEDLPFETEPLKNIESITVNLK